MGEAGIAVRTLLDLAGEEIVRGARPAHGCRGVALDLNAGTCDRQNDARDACPVHGRKPLLAEIGEASEQMSCFLRSDIDHGRTPIVDRAGVQEMLFQGNLLDHASSWNFSWVMQIGVLYRIFAVLYIMLGEVEISNAWGGVSVAKKIRGVTFEENANNSMGLESYNLSHRFGYQSPNWPYFEDVKIERIHYMAKSGVLSPRITTSMHNTTHIDAPAHVVQGTPFIDEVPLPHFFGSGIVV